jgi:VWFA-related protein
VQRVATVPVVAVALAFAYAPAAEPLQRDLRESVEVRRVLVDVRALDDGGNPVRGLAPEDLRVRVGGMDARVEAIDWVAGATRDPGAPEVAGEVGVGDERGSGRHWPGRLIVLFFQRDILAVRGVGLMQMVAEARKYLDTLGPDDRVAIVMYDYHLHLYADFTDDHDHLRAILRGALVPPDPLPEAGTGVFPSLFRHLDGHAAEMADYPETGVLVVARALEPLPGAKSILYFGWGMGKITGSGTFMNPDYPDMREALRRSRTALFSIDFVQSDIHGLEGPLITAAGESGGKYVKAYQFSIRAMKSVARALEGHYELTLVPPEGLEPGEHALRIRVRDRRARIHHPLYVRVGGESDRPGATSSLDPDPGLEQATLETPSPGPGGHRAQGDSVSGRSRGTSDRATCSAAPANVSSSAGR